MAEYIDRQAAIEAVCGCIPHSCDIGFCGFACSEAGALSKLPAADVRPVVLCRDCIHARHYTNKIKCGYWSEQTASEIVCEDDFCSFGEKREES